MSHAESNQPDSIPPVVCTLGTKPLATRVLEWADLRPLATERHRTPAGSSASFPIEHADAIEDLAARELDCCGSWLQITTARRDDRLDLTVTTTNPDGVEVIHGMLGSVT